MGFPAGSVVCDALVKTRTDLAALLELGVHTNLESEQEVEVVAELLQQQPPARLPTIGLRINPLVGPGSIPMNSTATAESKFGLALREKTLPRLVELYCTHPWLNGVHIHVGSQGMGLTKLVAGCGVMLQLARAVEKVRPGQITVLDIGGGVSTSYSEPDEPQQDSYAAYRALLERELPELLSGRYRVVTEMGRSVV